MWLHHSWLRTVDVGWVRVTDAVYSTKGGDVKRKETDRKDNNLNNNKVNKIIHLWQHEHIFRSRRKSQWRGKTWKYKLRRDFWT